MCIRDWEAKLGDGQPLVDHKTVVVATNLWLNVSNLGNGWILLEFRKVTLLVAWKMEWGHEDIRERMDCSEYQLNGDTSYSGKFSVFHFPVFLFSIWVESLIHWEVQKQKRIFNFTHKFGDEFRTYRWKHLAESLISVNLSSIYLHLGIMCISEN